MRRTIHDRYPIVPFQRPTMLRPAPSNFSNASVRADQRIIYGAQVSLASNEVCGENNCRSQSEKMPRDEEVHPDAFGLEILAQSQASRECYRNVASQGDLPYGEGQAMHLNPRSRFAESSHITPYRGFVSSSSDAASPSSPLMRLQKGGIQGQREIKAPFSNTSLSIRGIVLVRVHELPDKYRSLFPFAIFNAVQSKCFHPIYKEDTNMVLSAPTGSGKTVIMELAICRLLDTAQDKQFKVIYQAPTKSLCSERFRDWNKKFHSLGLQCAELTGDTPHTQPRSFQNSQIIITTPEKWDNMTRKWKDHAQLMQQVKLFLIDEVHILKEPRGATLEVVVSRMKTIKSNVRFVALSATIPNSEDIATWLGKDMINQHVPATREHFGEEFRPVKLKKFVYGYKAQGSHFAFDRICGGKLPDIIATHSCEKPIMIFCCTRSSATVTAKELAKLWSTSNPHERKWKGPKKQMEVYNSDLKATITAGVAFHHAGLGPSDRRKVETGFLEGNIGIICCTSTLAVGINLPCHLVIIKNTVGWQNGDYKEYSDLEIMQMLGRAGRPQFDDSATAVILTRKERVDHYEKLVGGSESLESCLHLNLIDHLNAEIGLGNVTDIESAIKWLAGTFLFVRLRRNPTHYQLEENAAKVNEDEMLRQICEHDIRLLQDCQLVVTSQFLKSTLFGDAMARYHIQFDTMRTFLSLKSHESLSQILTVISSAEEFREIRLKCGEKSLYKEINLTNGIRFPIKVDIALPAHKACLLIQSELGAVDFPDGEQFQKHRLSFQQDKTFVFAHVNRLVRCIIDCQISLEDSITLKNTLELARSLGARVWDNSPLQMKQIEQVGDSAVRKLAAAGVESIEDLETMEAHRIEMILSKNPPFGMKLLDRLAEFPKLRVSVKLEKKEFKPGKLVKVSFRAEIGFLNQKCPSFFQRRPVYVCFLAEVSDGRMVDFRRIRATRLRRSHEILLSVSIKCSGQHIMCYAMCDDIAGTMRSAELKLNLPESMHVSRANDNPGTEKVQWHETKTPRTSGNVNPKPKSSPAQAFDVFGSDDIPLEDFLVAEQNQKPLEPLINTYQEEKPLDHISKTRRGGQALTKEPSKLQNGRWACNHRCKDKTECKHLCCREGLDKPPKPVNKQNTPKDPGQMKLLPGITKKDAQEPHSASGPGGKDEDSTKKHTLKPHLPQYVPGQKLSTSLTVAAGTQRQKSGGGIITNDIRQAASNSARSSLFRQEYDTGLSGFHDVETPRGHKRQRDLMSTNYSDSSEVKKNRKGQAEELCPVQDHSIDGNLASKKCGQASLNTALSPEHMSSDWEHIDTALLNEFKDIIEFF